MANAITVMREIEFIPAVKLPNAENYFQTLS